MYRYWSSSISTNLQSIYCNSVCSVCVVRSMYTDLIVHTVNFTGAANRSNSTCTAHRVAVNALQLNAYCRHEYALFRVANRLLQYTGQVWPRPKGVKRHPPELHSSRPTFVLFVGTAFLIHSPSFVPKRGFFSSLEWAGSRSPLPSSAWEAFMHVNVRSVSLSHPAGYPQLCISVSVRTSINGGTFCVIYGVTLSCETLQFLLAAIYHLLKPDLLNTEISVWRLLFSETRLSLWFSSTSPIWDNLTLLKHVLRPVYLLLLWLYVASASLLSDLPYSFVWQLYDIYLHYLYDIYLQHLQNFRN